MAEATGGTRERILEVSLRLFTEQGYDGTSLREIAEELGVTKAALYYHFSTKEAILQSLVASITQEITAFAEWARQQPSSDATRLAVLQKAVDLVFGPTSRVIAMVQQNQTAMREFGQSREGEQDEVQARVETLREVIDPLVPADASYEDQVRARVGLFSVFASLFLSRDLSDEADEQEKRDVALRIACGVVGLAPPA